MHHFQQFLINNKNIKYYKNLNLKTNHKIFYKKIKNHTISNILHKNTNFIKKIKPHNIILIIKNNNIQHTTSSKKLTTNIKSLISILHYKFKITQIHIYKLLPQFKQYFNYNNTINKINILLKSSLHKFKFTSF